MLFAVFKSLTEPVPRWFSDVCLLSRNRQLTVNAFLDTIHLWLEHNTGYLGPAIAMVACLESLVVVGMVVPGVAMLFAMGAIAGAASVSIYWVMFWGFIGAVVGDGISYLVGVHWHNQVRNWWPFNHHPDWLTRGETFFHRHGVSSVVIGRFFGPVRPVVPAVAGMMGMSPIIFFTANLLSAVVWSPVYLVPGYLTGAALEFHDQIPRALLVALIAIIMAAVTLPALLLAVHRRWQPRLAWYPALVLALLVISLCATGYLAVVEQRIAPWMQLMNLPWLQQEFGWLVAIASAPLLSLLFVVTSAWLCKTGQRRTLGWLLLGGLATACSIWLTRYIGIPIAGPTTSGAFILFVTSALLAEHQPVKLQLLATAGATLLILLQGFATLVLQIHPLSGVLHGLGLGLFWALTVLAVRHQWPE